MPRGSPGVPKTQTHRAALRFSRRGKKDSDETRAKKSAASRSRKANLGKTFSPEWRAALSASRLGKRRGKYVQTEDGLRRMREAAARRLRVPNRVSYIEKAVKGVLDVLGVDYVFQYPVAGFVADFYVPSRNLILECDGEYWHALPKMRARDERHDAKLVALGYRVARLSGKTITRDALRSVREVLQFQYF